MKKSKRCAFIFSTLVLAAILFPGFHAQAASEGKNIELRLAHMFPVGAPAHQHMDRWAEKIAAESNGSLKIRIFPSNTLITAPEMYDGVVKGAADIGFAWRYKPKAYAVGVLFPFLLSAPDTATAGKVYDDIWKQFPELMAEEWKDVKILWLEPSMPVYLFSRKPLHSIEDMKGQQIRVPSRELADLMKQLGATPAYMSAADFIIGLDKGTVDGACGLFAIIPDFKLGGKIKNVLMLSLGVSTPVMVIMNKDSYKRLPADLQRVLDESGEWGKKDSIEYWSKLYEDSIKYCNANDIELIYPPHEQRAKLMSIIESSRDKVGEDLDKKGYPGTEIVQFIRERVKRYAQ